MVRKKVGSITLAVGLITVGVLLFSKNFIDISIKDIYKYWPVLLIGLGLEMILFMVLYGRNNSEVKLSVDGLCIAFIIILGVISNGVTFFNIDDQIRLLPDIHGNSIFGGVRYRSEVRETFMRDNISGSYNIKELKIRNSFGDIKVLPADSNSIKVEAEVRVKSNDDGKARAYAKDAVQIKEGETTEISPKYPSDEEKGDYSIAEIDFTIYVPKQANVNAESSFGDVNVEGIGGNCVIETKNGEVKALDIGGNAIVDNSFGDIEVRRVKGNAEITDKNGEIIAEEIAGGAFIENHFGDIDAVKVGGDLKVINNNGRITVRGIGGKAEITGSFGDVNVEEIGGDIVIENKNGRIEADEVKGSARIQNSFGDIYYDSDRIDNGNITARTKFGDINCDKPLEISKSGQETTAKGKLGTGQYTIELITNNGNINIE